MKYLFIYLFRRKKLIKTNVEKVGDNVFLKNLFICFILLDINKDTNNDKISQILIIHTFNILYNIQYYNII